jgi:hypothetical protein
MEAGVEVREKCSVRTTKNTDGYINKYLIEELLLYS